MSLGSGGAVVEDVLTGSRISKAQKSQKWPNAVLFRFRPLRGFRLGPTLDCSRCSSSLAA